MTKRSQLFRQVLDTHRLYRLLAGKSCPSFSSRRHFIIANHVVFRNYLHIKRATGAQTYGKRYRHIYIYIYTYAGPMLHDYVASFPTRQLGHTLITQNEPRGKYMIYMHTYVHTYIHVHTCTHIIIINSIMSMIMIIKIIYV